MTGAEVWIILLAFVQMTMKVQPSVLILKSASF